MGSESDGGNAEWVSDAEDPRAYEGGSAGEHGRC